MRSLSGVLVITVWTLAVIWLVASLSEIAVERMLVPSLCVSAVGEIACSR